MSVFDGGCDTRGDFRFAAEKFGFKFFWSDLFSCGTSVEIDRIFSFVDTVADEDGFGDERDDEGAEEESEKSYYGNDADFSVNAG